MKYNILLTGASGGIGYKVFQQLLKSQKYNLTIFIRKSRKNIKRFKSFDNQVNIKFGDLTRKEDLTQIREPYDAVIHLAAIIPPMAYKSQASTHTLPTREYWPIQLTYGHMSTV